MTEKRFKTIKTSLYILCFIFIILSMALPLYSAYEINHYGFETKGLYLILITYILYVVSTKIKDTTASVVMFWLIIIGYIIVTIEWFSSALLEFITLKPAFFIFYLALILFIFLFILNDLTVKDPATKITSEPLSDNGIYILCYYPETIADKVKVFKSVIIYNTKKQILELCTYNDILNKTRIKKRDIIRIEQNPKTITGKETKMHPKKEPLADYSLANAIIKSFGEKLISENLVDNVVSYFEAPKDELQVISITYKTDTEEKKISFITKDDAETLKEKLKKITN